MKAAPKYRVWTGRGEKTEWIEVTRVLEVIKLTGQNRVGKSDMKLVEAMQSYSGVAPDVAVGRDVYENPDQDLSCTQRSRTTRR